jgi:hypothetical protein
MPVEADPELADAFASLRRASEIWVRRERTRARLPAGVGEVDALLGGGWPEGKLNELVGPASAGRTGVAAATVAAATARGEVVAWIDAADTFDLASMDAAGVHLERVLWVRPQAIEEAVRAAELVLETRGFTVLVLDLGLGAEARRRQRSVRPRRQWGGRPHSPSGKSALVLRLVRAVERAGAVALVLAERPWAGSLAGTTVALERGQARWGGGTDGAPRWLAGIRLRVRGERGAAAHVARPLSPVGRAPSPVVTVSMGSLPAAENA